MVNLQHAAHHYDSENIVSLPDIILNQGEQLLIHGLSGSGKTTLLHVLAGLLSPTTGKVLINDTELYFLSESNLDKFRGQTIGIIFQQMHLVNTLTVFENIRLAQYMAGVEQNEKRIREVLKQLDIPEKESSFSDELSQGEKQRVSIARAVVNHPKLILADEPTSSLDDKRSEQVITLLKGQAQLYDASLIISTHDSRVKSHFSKSIGIAQPTKMSV